MSKGISNDTNHDLSFWRTNTRPLPGSVLKVNTSLEVSESTALDTTGPVSASLLEETSSFRMPITPKKQGKKSTTGHSTDKSSFQQYEESTLDAWDDGDDDLLLRLKLDSNMIQTTASQVIHSHSLTSTPPKQQQSNVPTEASKQHTTQSHSQSTHQQNGSNHKVNRSLSEAQTQRDQARQQKFDNLLHSPPKNLIDELGPLSWSGIPYMYRPMTWKILSGYLPAALDRREQTLERKRKEYFGFLEQYFGTRHQDQYQDIFRQIHIDVPRMNPLIPLFQNKVVQELFERILYIWAIRHPASGYVQGINDLVTPFFIVFLSEFIDTDFEVQDVDISKLSKTQLDMIEADSYWCMSKLLDGIQDNYTFAQPGIQTKVAALKELTLRIDANLHNHIEKHGIEFLQFTFRWMNNLLMRELPLRCTIRLWDTYLAEPEGFANYHLYVCAAFLTRFSKQLQKETDFQGLMTTLQNLPTQQWHDSEIAELTAEAYRLKYMFADAPQHFKQKS